MKEEEGKMESKAEQIQIGMENKTRQYLLKDKNKTKRKGNKNQIGS